MIGLRGQREFDWMELDAEGQFSRAEEAEHPDLKVFVAYWHAKRDGRAMPGRGDLAPSEMKAYLPRLHIYDVIDGGRDFRIRLMGTRLSSGWRRDPTGALVSEQEDKGFARRVPRILNKVLSTRAPVRFTAEHAAADRFRHQRVECVWLPLGLQQIESIIAQTIFSGVNRLGRA
jgi:hypothetical protein